MTMNAAAAASAHEEEELSGAEAGMAGGWEFKILRGGWFRGARLQRALEQERTFGWELHEKIDDGRLRLRRRVEERLVDSRREGDPYRSHACPTNPALVAFMIGTLIASAGAGVAVTLLLN